MQKIEDQDLAAKLRAKVNDFNKSSLVLPGSVTLAFVGLPEIAHQLLG